MLSRQNISDIARLTRLKPYQQEKHYLQTLILSSLYSKLRSELVFKGGTALFFSIGLPRFSEDLDFTLTENIDLKSLAENVSRDLDLFGVKNQLRKLERSAISWSFKIAAEGPLFTREIERCFVAVDISTREKIAQMVPKEITPIYPDILPFNVLFLGEEDIVAEKIWAILTRNSARDVFDLHFLLNKNIAIQMPMVAVKIQYYQKNFSLKEFTEKLEEKKAIWESELQQLVIGSLPPFADAKRAILENLHKVL